MLLATVAIKQTLLLAKGISDKLTFQIESETNGAAVPKRAREQVFFWGVGGFWRGTQIQPHLLPPFPPSI